MAADWIKIRLDLAEDPAVIRMADELGVREETIVGYCHAFWSWVSRQCHDGTVTGVTLLSLGRRINLPGFPELLVTVGWLEYDDSGDLPVIHIPHFERHLSQGGKQRALTAERQRRSRNGDVTKVSRSKRDKSVTREEKRREELSTNVDSKPLTPSDIVFPQGLDTDVFRTGWLEWEAYKFEQFKFTFKPTGRKAAFTQAIKRGPQVTLELIQQSMANGWKGLIEKDAQSGNGAQPHTPGPSAESSPEVQAVFAEIDRKRAQNEQP